MNRMISCVGAIAVAALGAAACGDDYIAFPDEVAALNPTAPDDAGTSGSAGGAGAGSSAGRAGAGGRAGGAGAGGRAAGAGGAAGGAAAGGRAGAGGSSAVTGGSAGVGVADAGGVDAPDAGGSDASASEPVDPGAEPPEPVDVEPAEAVCEIAVDTVTSLPHEEVWQTTDDTEDVVNIAGCQVCDNTGDHIVTFTAPQTATFRFAATSSGDVELAVYAGDCDAEPDGAACGEDVEADNDGDDRVQVELEVAQGDSVTVVVSESCEEEGGEGTLTIDVAD